MILQIVVAIDMHALGVEKIYLHILKFWYNNVETCTFFSEQDLVLHNSLLILHY